MPISELPKERVFEDKKLLLLKNHHWDLIFKRVGALSY